MQRRNRLLIASIGVTGIVLVIVLVLFVQSRAGAVPPSYSGDVSIYVTPDPSELPLVRITDISFVDPLHGWVLGYVCQTPNDTEACHHKTLLWDSTDGGATWSRLPAPQADFKELRHEFNLLRFANTRDGFAFEPGLFSTHDGGTTWEDNTREEETTQLNSAGSTLWALSRKCVSDEQCYIRLITSADMGRTWQWLRLR